MLLLIAIANVVWWFPGTTTHVTVWDQTWVVARTMLVDQRAYPLFAFLLGFGLTVLHQRSIQRDLAAGYDHVTARHRSTSMLRRRGLWLAIFGAIHAVLFAGDILGAYGVAIMLFAAAVTAGRRRVLCWLGLGSAVVAVGMLSLNAVLAGLTSAVRDDSAAASSSSAEGLSAVSQGTMNVALWAVNIPVTILTSLVVAMMCWGALMGQGKVLTHPADHLRTHRRFIVLGGLGIALGLPYGLIAAGLWTVDAQVAAWVFVVQTVCGALGALGWCGVIALMVARSGSTAKTRFSTAVEQLGRMSLSGYLAQTVVFTILTTAFHLIWPQWTPGVVVAGLLAVGVGILTVGAARMVTGTKYDRPVERMLRAAMS